MLCIGIIASDVAEFSGGKKDDLGSETYRKLVVEDIDSVEEVRDLRER